MLIDSRLIRRKCAVMIMVCPGAYLGRAGRNDALAREDRFEPSGIPEGVIRLHSHPQCVRKNGPERT